MSKKPSQYPGDQLRPFIAPFRFSGSGDFHLKSHRTNAKGGLDKDKAEKLLEANRKRLRCSSLEMLRKNFRITVPLRER